MRASPRQGLAPAWPVSQCDSVMTASTDLHQRHRAAVARGVASLHPLYVARAVNAELWDVDGRRYIDFAGGIGVLNVGHNHPRVLAAVEAQARSFMHTGFQVAPYGPYVELAELLITYAPGRFAKKALFLTSGAEAVENAVKVARAATGRPGVIAFVAVFTAAR